MSNRTSIIPEPLLIRAAKKVGDFARQTPLGQAVQGNFSGAFNQIRQRLGQGTQDALQNPTQLVENFGPMGVAGVVKPVVQRFGQQAIKQIDNLTKDEMIKAINYIRLKKPFDPIMEETIGHLANKFGATGRRLGIIANQFEKLVENTKTKDVLNRKPLFKSERLK